MTSPVQQVDLTNCDIEPIHIPGYIQPHGCLVACDSAMRTVLRHSLNWNEITGLAGDIIGRPIEEFFGNDLVHDLRNALTVTANSSRPAMLPKVKLPNGKTFDIAIHRYKSVSIIELEPASDESQPLHTAQLMIDRIREADNVDSLISRTTRLVKAMLGYDRVMVYRFEQDGAGKVISEAKQPALESFLGQYFPASDIPQQARALYLKNTLRIISDSNGERIPIEPVIDASGEPLDLSFSHLRSVSPIHCEYLRNMGVSASMSISIINDGELWGLIACHHYSPRILPMPMRIAAEMFGEFFSLHLQALKQKKKLATAYDAHASLDKFLRLAAHHNNVEELLVENLPDFSRLLPCDGVGVWMNERWFSIGYAPPELLAPQLGRLVSSVSEGRVWATHALINHLPEAESISGDVAGVLAVPLSQVKNDYLMFFRRELVQTLNWGGNPDKSYETGPLGDRLTPRKSFALWKETVHKQAQPWTEEDRQIAEAARVALVEVAFRHSELMAGERAQAEVRQRMLNEELNHRVKNVLAIIKSLVGNPTQEGRTLQEYVSALKGRIQALSFAHDQVVRGEGGGLLRDLLDAELSPHRSPDSEIEASGPNILLDSRAFSVMALVLHELATNAAKYGALALAGGKLSISWELNDVGDCVISWRETVSATVTPPTRTGFGSALISRSVPYDLGGKSKITYHTHGIEAEIVLPARHATAGPSSATHDAAVGIHNDYTPYSAEEPLRVFLVEDQMLIAMDVEYMLESHGVTNIETSTSSAAALDKLKSQTPDVAILDINLGSDTSIPVAYELLRRNIPFMFATGYADGIMIPPEFSHVPVIRKPYDEEALMATIGRLVDKTVAA
ncbi:HWE histidine kinase domain-containing protein [Agrobacterium rosae]